MSALPQSSKKVVLITGCSSGFGRLSAETLALQGHCVYATMRDPYGRNHSAAADLQRIASRKNINIQVLALDVTDDTSAKAAVKKIIQDEGHIDVLVNNAGIMNVGITEAYELDQIKHQMEVNFYGPARLDRLVIPYMRKQKSGLLIHVSSLAGRLVFPYFGSYCASKFAMEALAESYRYELSSQGIDSIIVEPGPFDTSLISNAPKPHDHARLAEYGESAAYPDKMLAAFEAFYQTGDAVPPQQVADDIARLIDIPHQLRPLRTVSGLDYGLRKLNSRIKTVQGELLETLKLQSMDPNAAPHEAASVKS